MRSRIVAVLILCAVFVGMSGCARTPAELEKMSIGITDRPFAALVVIAEQQGFFAEHGVAVEIRRYPLGPPAIKDMLDGRLDVAMSADFGYANTSFASKDFRVVCGIAHDVDHQIATRAESGISAPTDLAGKRVGLPAGAAQFSFMLSRLLEESDVPSASVTVVELGSGELAQSLMDGQVDAIMTWRPIATADRALLEGRVDLMPMTGVGDTWSLLALRPETISGRATAVKGLLSALTDAQRWAEVNPEKAVKLARASFKQADAYPEGWPAAALYVDLSQTCVVRLEEEAKWIATTTGRTPLAAMRDLVETAPLAGVGPDLVTVPDR
ncbi:MAG: ABC transporter substrate-binding protein [Coriobacteriia bacterium]|nr:ABC transporter substrate-binding protein [Coriobacteriia bacterium]